ncbi:hypothetical protein C8R43DRAFT_972608 [Mycena crocata]|nr:hypothetical protein C8R43DRAFT_972608 [Mycena crocata]
MPKATSSSTRIRRPGPLKDLPLDPFLPDNPNLPQRPNKRVHSPGGPSLFSPTKRRILAEEGILSAGSFKSPIRVRAIPVTHNGGGDSVAKKLDFGLPKNSPARASTPPSAPTSAIEAHSTRLTRPSVSPTTPDAFMSPPPETDYFPIPGTTTSRPVSYIPRDIPPPVDPQSIHYPGFHVHQDAYIVTGLALDLEANSLSSPQKENAAPRRKPRKSSTAPASSDPKMRLASPDPKLTKANSTPCTPGRLHAERSNSATPTPRRPDVVLVRDTRLTPKLRDTDRRELRRRLEEEVDDIPSDDEEDSL